MMTLDSNDATEKKVLIYNIERHALHDGPGIRTLVFFKGCPLHCLWCSNPEGQKAEPELLFKSANCISCMRCVHVCPKNAIEWTDRHVIAANDRIIYNNRERCDACGRCIDACPVGAREIAGTWMTVEDVAEEVLKDEVFYRNSGGGITCSGGSPLLYPFFVRSLFEVLKRHVISTAVETCGVVPQNHFEMVLKFTDLFLYDVKHMDADKHRKFTGRGNKQLLSNLNWLDRSGAQIVVRVPVVPGFNDNANDLAAIAEYTMQLSSTPPIHLLPYHTLGRSKYLHLERKYQFEGYPLLLIDTLDNLVDIVKKINPRVQVGG